MTQSTPQVITEQMRNAFDIKAIKANEALTQELSPPSSLDTSVIRNIDTLGFDFKTSITPSTRSFSYLVVLCPQLKYGFLKALQALERGEKLYPRAISIAIPTLSSPRQPALTVSFVPARNLETTSQKFMDLLIPGAIGQEIPEEMLRDKTGVVEIGPGTGQVDLDWFPEFGEKTALLRMFTRQSFVGPLVVRIGPTEDLIELDQRKDSVSSKATHWIPSRSSLTKWGAFTILGAVLIQGSFASERDLCSIDLNWQSTINVSSNRFHRSYSIPVTLGTVGDTTESASKQAICILIDPFDFSKNQSFTFSGKGIRFQSLLHPTFKVISTETTETKSLETVCSFYRIKDAFVEPSDMSSVSFFLGNQGYMSGPLSEVSANAFMQSKDATQPLSVTRFDRYDTPQTTPGLGLPSSVWKLSSDGQSPPRLESGDGPEYVQLQDPFVPSEGIAWSLAIPYILDVEFTPVFTGVLTTDQTVTFRCDYAIDIDVWG